MKIYDAVANAFVKEGTTAVFGLLGDGNMLWSLAMSKHASVKIIDARHEGAALSMAEGWARATGKVGVCSVTHGPGISRITTSLIAATRSRVPVVVYTSRSAFNNERINQYLEQERLVKCDRRRIYRGISAVICGKFSAQGVLRCQGGVTADCFVLSHGYPGQGM